MPPKSSAVGEDEPPDALRAVEANQSSLDFERFLLSNMDYDANKVLVLLANVGFADLCIRVAHNRRQLTPSATSILDSSSSRLMVCVIVSVFHSLMYLADRQSIVCG